MRSDLPVGTEPTISAERVEFSLTVQGDLAGQIEADLRQILDDLGLGDSVRIE